MRCRGLSHSIEVLTDRERRVVRCQHQPDRPAKPLLGEVRDGVFDEWSSVLHPQGHVVPAVGRMIERSLQRDTLRIGALRQR